MRTQYVHSSLLEEQQRRLFHHPISIPAGLMYAAAADPETLLFALLSPSAHLHPIQHNCTLHRG